MGQCGRCGGILMRVFFWFNFIWFFFPFTTIESEVRRRTHVASTHLRCRSDDAVAISICLNRNKLLFLISSSVEFLLLEFIIAPSTFGRALTICASHFITKNLYSWMQEQTIKLCGGETCIAFILFYNFRVRETERMDDNCASGGMGMGDIRMISLAGVWQLDLLSHFREYFNGWQWADALKWNHTAHGSWNKSMDERTNGVWWPSRAASSRSKCCKCSNEAKRRSKISSAAGGAFTCKTATTTICATHYWMATHRVQ